MLDFYYIAWLFIIYAFLGWVAEVGYSAIKKGKLINRGFLNGAWCPIYGVGAVLIIVSLSSLWDHIVIMFLASVFITSAIELATGVALKKIYNTRWWDYSDRRFNFRGYICLSFSIIWGAVGVVLVRAVNPLVLILLSLIPKLLGTIILCALIALFIVDLVITVLALNNLLSRLERLDRLAAEMRSLSDELSVTVYEKATELNRIKETSDKKVSEFKDTNEKRLKELKEKYQVLLEEKRPTHRRLLRAFPDIRVEGHQQQLEKLKNRLQNYNKR